jgi:hypothetical protein
VTRTTKAIRARALSTRGTNKTSAHRECNRRRYRDADAQGERADEPKNNKGRADEGVSSLTNGSSAHHGFGSSIRSPLLSVDASVCHACTSLAEGHQKRRDQPYDLLFQI